jgi:hypothetical protein
LIGKRAFLTYENRPNFIADLEALLKTKDTNKLAVLDENDGKTRKEINAVIADLKKDIDE